MVARKPMPPRYIAVPFQTSGTFGIIQTPTLSAVGISSSEIDITISYTGPPAVSVYVFEYSSALNGPFIPLASQNTALFKHMGLNQSATWYYRARVQVTDGRFSSFTSTAIASTAASVPPQVGGLVATLVTGPEIDIAWNTTQFADTYNVYLNGVLLASGIVLTSYKATGLTSGGSYQFNVSGVNSIGEGSLSAPLTAGVPDPTQAPVITSVGTQGVVDPTTSLRVIHTLVPNADHYAVRQKWSQVSNYSPLPQFNHQGTTIDVTGGVSNQSYDTEIGAANASESVVIWSNPGTASTQPVAGGAVKKWNPGHYAQSTSFDNQSGKNSEINLIRAGPPQVLGLWLYYYITQFENSTAGQYSWTVLDNDYVNLTGWNGSTYTPPSGGGPTKHLSLYINTEANSGRLTNMVPSYILNNPSTYGSSPTAGQGGWWTNPNGGVTFAHWRPSVSSRLMAFYQALGAHVLPDGFSVDTSPYIEWVSPYGESAELAPADPSWSASAWLTELKLIMSTCRTAFPHTNIAMTNNFSSSQSDTNAIEQLLPSNVCAASGPDVFPNSPTWGQASYLGGSGGIDLRGKVAYIASVQSTEQGDGSYFSAPTIFAYANSTLQSSHMAWAIISWTPGGHVDSNYLGSASSLAQWNTNPAGFGGVLRTITTNPLTHTAYPTSYP